MSSFLQRFVCTVYAMSQCAAVSCAAGTAVVSSCPAGVCAGRSGSASVSEAAAGGTKQQPESDINCKSTTECFFFVAASGSSGTSCSGHQRRRKDAVFRADAFGDETSASVGTIRINM